MDDDPSALTPGTVLAGRFRVVRCMGVGGMGSVYEIEHELTKHRRALKLLHAAMAANSGVVERFLREASAAGRVGNQHIVETFDAGTLETGAPYLVMEMLRGETLSDRILRGPMPVSEVIDLVGQACDGVHAAHEAGIVHRDLKPDNLFVVDVEGRPFVKILDFGISKFDPGKTGGMALTQEGAALGTPYYMSPEQIRGEANLDARTDVYALGVILYECTAGQRPFEADALTQLAVLIHTGRPKPLAELRPDLPPGFSDLVARAMATDREQRTQSARGLRTELERFGAISFKGQAQIGPTPSVVAIPAQSVAARSLATSAAGVSVRAATANKKSQTGAIVAGFSILGLAAIGGTFFLRSGNASNPAPSAQPVTASVGAPAEPPTAVPASPPAAAASGSAVPSAAPALSASADRSPGSPRPAVSSPVIAPTLTPQVSVAPATPVTAGPGAALDKKARRTEEKGLAKDNPFR
jgi:hypothetical protein